MKVALLALGLTFVASSQADRLIPELGLSKPFVSHDFENHNYLFGGSTLMAKNYARLTSDQPDQRGWLVARASALPANFVVELEFKISGRNRALYGDGMALWFLQADQEVDEGPVFGLQDHFRGTALFIDTYRNHRPGKAFPFIMVMQNNGQQEYDRDNDGRANELAGFSARGLHNPVDNSRLRVTYSGGKFTVDLNYRGRWDHGFTLPLNLDGASKLAISAQTGELSAQHDIYGITVSALDYVEPQPEQWPSALANDPVPKRRKSSWLWWLIKWTFIVIAVVAAAKYYGKRSRRTSDLPFNV